MHSHRANTASDVKTIFESVDRSRRKSLPFGLNEVTYSIRGELCFVIVLIEHAGTNLANKN